MKIAFLNIYQNKVNRGAETYVFEVAKRLSQNHDVDVISDINYLNLLKRRYDVIIPTNGRLQVVLIRVIAWLSGAKMIVSGQSGIGLDDRINLYSFPDVFIALSTKALSWARLINKNVKSVYIPNGVDIKEFSINGSSYRHNLSHPVILAVGAFTEQKRLDLAIKATSKIKNASLLIAGGGGDLKNKLESLGNRLMNGRFKVITVDYRKMPDVYRSCDVFTLPSKTSESFGNVLVEAMACNLPVVATNDAIRKEIVGDAGILINPENEAEYAKSLNLVLKKRWNDTPRRQAEKYSWDLVVEKYERLLKELV